MVQKGKSKRSGKSKRTGGSDNNFKKIQLKERLKTFVRARGPQYLEDPNITSVGIGYKIREGKESGSRELCVQFTVARKVDMDQLETLGSRAIPKTVDIDGDSVPTDVIEREFRPSYELITPEAKDTRKQRLDPMVPGISVSHPTGTAGTLGTFVYELREGHACMLSNWHVLHTPHGTLGDAVVQPGPFDDNRILLNQAGKLLRSHLGVAGDCAIARIEDRGLDPSILGLDASINRLARPDLGDTVVKSGRTTGVTYGKVTRIETLTRINYGGDVGVQQIGGFEIGPDDDRPAPNNEISMGGDSGSVWLITDEDGSATDIMVGLHFAGEGRDNPDEHALACYAHAVFQKLEIGLEPPDEHIAVVELGGRAGYDRAFLGDMIPPPKLTGPRTRDVVKLGGSSLVHYTHFSVCLSRSRRLAHFVAWNIDGGKIRRLSRKGIKFRTDPRIDKKLQTDNEAYVDNRLDRGHIARRADLVWGAPAEARKANRDSFYFTNITPQHESFNQSSKRGLWGMLENAIFEDVDVDDLKVSVFAGPVFKRNDLQYRDLLVPRDYWKLIAYVDKADGTLKAKAYVLTQDDLLNDIEGLDLDSFRLWQVSIGDLEDRTKLSFDVAKMADDMAPERITEAILGDGGRWPVREVHARGDLVIW